MTELLLDFPTEHTGEHQVSAKSHQGMREALAAAFQGGIPPDPRGARAVFNEGIALIAGLEANGEISKKAAASLTAYMATLYLSVLISRLAEDLGATQRQPPLPDFLVSLFRNRK
jgi:hypothetical protein